MLKTKFKLFLLILLSFIFLFIPLNAHADEDFDISTDATYQVQNDGSTRVSQTISIKNKKEFVYTPSYKISIGLKEIKNLQASDANGSIESKLSENSDGKSIEVVFPRRVIGVGNINRFTVSFTTTEIAENKGSVWEVSVPGLSDPDNFTSYDATVRVPATFGPPDIVKPYKKFSSGQSYSFNKNEIGQSGIYILFGDSQYYTFDLTYNISNAQLVPVKTEIALPPTTSYQDIRIKSLVPPPLEVYEDEDGNWLAVYELSPKQRKTIQAKVIVKVYSVPALDTPGPATYDTQAAKYWEVSDTHIKSLAEQLKTPEAIYKYVVNELTYSFDKVSSKNVRLGAKEALVENDFAVCLEFTDLFVAIARAAGIPARAVEGYAYTQNSKLRPLSLVTDVLHSWPEYYDSTRKTWVMIDPTWGNTTHGMDYFNTLDFDHVAFVVKGKDSTYPVPAGGYKVEKNTKDVKVTLGGEEDFVNIVKTSIEPIFSQNVISGFPIGGTVVIKNNGNTPIENKVLVVNSELKPEEQKFQIDRILPFGQAIIPIKFDRTPFLTTSSFRVTILFDGNEVTKVVKVGLFPDYYWFILGGIIIVGSIVVAQVAYKTWSLHISRPK